MTPEQRLAQLQKFVEQKPEDAFARYALAMCLRSMGRQEEAVREFEELVRRAPEYVPSYLMLGQVLEALSRREEAARAYEAGVAAARAHDEHARGELSQALDALRTEGK
ncbi:MAG TPA: tetratricopeptide repeat protein [Anaeromyxobacteraceae bacterium]|nr:tetratricopeptide repeat protein [Anaeromyxobacteraceae bacterium]